MRLQIKSRGKAKVTRKETGKISVSQGSNHPEQSQTVESVRKRRARQRREGEAAESACN